MSYRPSDTYEQYGDLIGVKDESSAVSGDASEASGAGIEVNEAGDANGKSISKRRLLGWLQYAWRQLTSMRTALLLLLLLAVAAVPGSLVPQRSSDPNGVAQYIQSYPNISLLLDRLQMFDVYISVWFSAIYLLLFVSLIGCVIPRVKHHFIALRAQPPATPANLNRLPGYFNQTLPAGVSASTALDTAEKLLRARHRVRREDKKLSISAERGYGRESGNLLFHSALVGVLIAVGFGGGFSFTGQRVIIAGQSFVNTLAAYDSFTPGRFFNENSLQPYRLSLNQLDVSYEIANRNALGQAIDFTAHVKVTDQTDFNQTEQSALAGTGQATQSATIKVNEPLSTHGTEVYLLGNGYAPKIVVRNPAGKVVFSEAVPFLPQNTNLTSIGVVKVPDGLAQQLGLVGFFYPTQYTLASGAFASQFPDLVYPRLTLNVYAGDLGINGGAPKSVYALDTSKLTQLNGGTTGRASIELGPGDSDELPDGLGTITFERADPNGPANDLSKSVARFASFQFHHDPAQLWVLVAALSALSGLLAALFIPRRRIWLQLKDDGQGQLTASYAGLARGDDPNLVRVVREFAEAHAGMLRG